MGQSSGFEGILSNVTTPLALAALVVLVLGGLLSQTRGRRAADGGRTNTYVFVIVLVVSLAANVVYLIQMFLFSEALLIGSVRGKDAAIGRAYVDVLGVGRTASNDDGSFQISIPYSRQSKDYTIDVTAAGHRPWHDRVAGPRPQPVEVHLAEKGTGLGASLSPSRDILVTQNVGDPLLFWRFTLVNEIGKDLKIEELRLSVRRGDEQRRFNPAMVQLGANTPPQPLAGPFPILPGAPVDVTFLFVPNGLAIQNLLMSLAKLDPEQSALLCREGKPPSPVFVDRFERFFDGAFFWKSGDYDLEVQAKVNGEWSTSRQRFSLSGDEAASLERARGLLKTCGGIWSNPGNWSSIFWSGDGAVNSLVAQISERS